MQSFSIIGLVLVPIANGALVPPIDVICKVSLLSAVHSNSCIFIPFLILIQQTTFTNRSSNSSRRRSRLLNTHYQVVKYQTALNHVDQNIHT
ncbi:cell adhesion molecule-related/down-regulated by oncogenes [Trifolium repens]|nr:cell adhesion molecule-related/down-regulated by oncogenes [Trifolium repens]